MWHTETKGMSISWQHSIVILLSIIHPIQLFPLTRLTLKCSNETTLMHLSGAAGETSTSSMLKSGYGEGLQNSLLAYFQIWNMQPTADVSGMFVDIPAKTHRYYSKSDPGGEQGIEPTFLKSLASILTAGAPHSLLTICLIHIL